jgi:hypothetical protein
MPKFVRARPPLDDGENGKIRKLAGARHAPADWSQQLGCHPDRVRRWLHRFNAAGLDGPGDRPGAGRRRRIAEAQRPVIIAMARSVPPGRLDRDGAGDCRPAMSAARRSGPWTPWPRWPGTPASPWGAARCSGSCWRRRSAGGMLAAGRQAPARSSPQKDQDRGAVHRPAARFHGDLRRLLGGSASLNK